ncbi:hypothetical protein [Chitinophaga sp. CF418]|uniref:hypothetical protein n=1 Tax=Chitinophaga sp. CF418 TaxID=1855287 RepID=UPI00091523B9|nr:hypothetical protein [Chitinophaga sp. CF418]SHN45122.1 hypothetical protein SAMN05216311_11910 [Chitinophaga sp. CF418]
MAYTYKLNRELLVYQEKIAPFELQTGKVYFLKSNIDVLTTSLMDKQHSDHDIVGKAYHIPYSNVIKWFRFRSVYQLLEKRIKNKEIVDVYFQFFNLPHDVIVKDLRGVLCNEIFNFEYYYHRYDLFLINSAGMDIQSIADLRSYMLQRNTAQKCVLIYDTALRRNDDNSVVFGLEEWK